MHNAGGDIAAEGGRPDPNDAVWVKEADVRAVLERNLLSTILVCQRVARDMMERRAGAFSRSARSRRSRAARMA